VRNWARKFLTDASWAPASSGPRGAVYFFVGMVRNMVALGQEPSSEAERICKSQR
ncbi:smyd2a, partial [Symbiodinium sp. CCMP2456]